jgi:WD40 repeat protein
VAFSPDGTRLAGAGTNGHVYLWNLEDRAFLQLDGHLDRARDIAFGHDGAWLASVGDDDTIRVWDLHGGHGSAELHVGRPLRSVTALAGKRLAAAGEAGIYILELRLPDSYFAHAL